MICQGPELRPYLERGVGHEVADEAQFIGQLTNGEVTAVAAFTDWRKFDVELTLWSAGMLSRAFLRRLGRYAFDELGCVRVTARTSAKNAACIDVLTRCGFALEGVRRKGLDGETDLMLFGILGDGFRYGKEERKEG